MINNFISKGVKVLVLTRKNSPRNGVIPQSPIVEVKYGRVYVLGNCKAEPLAEYIEKIRQAAAPGGRVRLGAVPYGKKQIMYLCADISELQKDTGWEPATEFAEGIRKTIENT